MIAALHLARRRPLLTLVAIATGFLACGGQPASSVSSQDNTTLPPSCEASNTCYVAPLPPITDNTPLPYPPCGSLNHLCQDGSTDADYVLPDAGNTHVEAGTAEAGADAKTTADAADAADSAKSIADASDAAVDGGS